MKYEWALGEGDYQYLGSCNSDLYIIVCPELHTRYKAWGWGVKLVKNGKAEHLLWSSHLDGAKKLGEEEFASRKVSKR